MNNQNLEMINNRELDKCLFNIVCITDKLYYNYGEGNINERNIYIFWGTNIYGEKRYLDSIIEKEPLISSKWYSFFQKIKRRGVELVLYGTMPNNDNMHNAFKLAFPESETFISANEVYEQSQKYLSKKVKANLLTYVSKIYFAQSEEEYKAAIESFETDFSKYKIIMDLSMPLLQKAKKYLYIDVSVRQLIFSYYFIYKFNYKSTILSHKKPYYQSVDEFVEMCLPLIKTNELGRRYSKGEWVDILNIIYQKKESLIKQYL